MLLEDKNLLDIKKLNDVDKTEYTKRTQINANQVIQPVQEIIANVQKNKDKAVHDYTLKFDKADVTNLKVSQEEIDQSVKNIDPKLKEALESCKKHKRFS